MSDFNIANTFSTGVQCIGNIPSNALHFIEEHRRPIDLAFKGCKVFFPLIEGAEKYTGGLNDTELAFKWLTSSFNPPSALPSDICEVSSSMKKIVSCATVIIAPMIFARKGIELLLTTSPLCQKGLELIAHTIGNGNLALVEKCSLFCIDVGFEILTGPLVTTMKVAVFAASVFVFVELIIYDAEREVILQQGIVVLATGSDAAAKCFKFMKLLPQVHYPLAVAAFAMATVQFSLECYRGPSEPTPEQHLRSLQEMEQQLNQLSG